MLFERYRHKIANEKEKQKQTNYHIKRPSELTEQKVKCQRRKPKQWQTMTTTIKGVAPTAVNANRPLSVNKHRTRRPAVATSDSWCLFNI